MPAPAASWTVVIARGDSGGAAAEDALAAAATAAGHHVRLVPHLYHLPEAHALWAELARLAGPTAWFSWLHPRPLRALLQRHGCWRAGDRCSALSEADPLALLSPASAGSGTPPISTPRAESPGPRWYPLIDPERCTGCGHCLQFCLFGVYGSPTGGAPRVVDPDRCKPGCPACARICPHGAIIFPLYEREPAIAGAPGTLMRPDAAGRRLWYQRTGRPCPACGRADREGDRGQGPACGECGRRAAGGASADDGLDDLIAELDRRSGGG